MKRMILLIAGAAILALSATSVVAAPPERNRVPHGLAKKDPSGVPHGLAKRNEVPEIDAAAGGSAIVLLSGLLLLLSERRLSEKTSVAHQDNRMV